MPRKFLSQLNGGTTIDDIFLVQDKELRTTKSGSLYIQAQLSDRTGVIDARMWMPVNHSLNPLAMIHF